MFPFGQVLPMILLKIVTMLFHPIFWLVVALVALQYRRMASIKENFLGYKTGGVWQDVLTATAFGLAGGVLGSVVMVVVGLTLNESGLIYLWPVAILLMLINARFLCFAYAGGILALGKLLFGFPPVNVPQVLALVAILHMVESLLILASGHLGAVPAYFRDRAGKVVGGFTLQKFWPIPIVALAVVGVGTAPGESIRMPEWWPLLKPGGMTGDPDNLVYALLTVVAGLGYGDLAIARNPREKSKLSSIFLAAYSLILLFLALGSAESQVVALAAALFSPLGHEAVIYLGRNLEFSRRPLYTPHPQGLRVLDVIPGSRAWEAGIRSGDVLVSVDGRSVFTRAQLEEALYSSIGLLELGYISSERGIYQRELVSLPPPGETLGLLPIPEGNEKNYFQLETAGPLGRWWRDFWQRAAGKRGK